MNLKKKSQPAILWKRVNCQRITSKNTRPRLVDTWVRDTVRRYWSADTLFWQLSIDHNIDVQSAFSWAPKVAKKCESKHWYPVVRTVGRSVTWLPNLLGWVDLFTHGVPLARFARGAPLWKAGLHTARFFSKIFLSKLIESKTFGLICFPRNFFPGLIYCDQEPLWLLNVIEDDC